MDVTTGLGLLLLVVAVGLIAVRLHGRILTHPGAVLICAAVTYHGVSEALLRLTSGYDPYRQEATAQDVADWVGLVSLAVLLYTVAYLAGLGRPRAAMPPGDADLGPVGWLDWRLLIVPTVLMVVLVARGTGVSPGPDATADTQQQSYWSAGLASQFLLIATALTAAALIIRFGRRIAVPTLIGQAVALALAGERLPVVVGGLATLFILTQQQIRLSRRQLSVVVVIIVTLWLAISNGRAVDSRASFGYQQSLTTRATTLWQGLSDPTGHSGDGQSLAARIDGNAWPAMVLHGITYNRRPPVGMATVGHDAELAVPQFLDPHKLNSDLTTRLEKAYISAQYAIPYLTVDHLPTLFGTWLAYGGPGGLLVIAIAVGLLFGRVDRWLNQRHTAVRTGIGLGLLNCALFYERSTEIYFVTLRGALLIATVLAAVQTLRRWRRAITKQGPASMAAPSTLDGRHTTVSTVAASYRHRRRSASAIPRD